MSLNTKQINMARNSTQSSSFNASAGMKQDGGKGEDVPEHKEQTAQMRGSFDHPINGPQKLTHFDEKLNRPSITEKRSMP